MQYHPELPSGLPGGAPTTTPGQTAQRALGCIGCAQGTSAPLALAGVGVGALSASTMQTRWEQTSMWAKLLGGAVLFAGVAYGVYRVVR